MQKYYYEPDDSSSRSENDDAYITGLAIRHQVRAMQVTRACT